MSENLEQKIDDLSKTLQAGTLTVPVVNFKPGKKIVARFATLPVTGLTVDFLVQVMEPIALVPALKRVTIALTMIKATEGKLPEDLLKELLLQEWHSRYLQIGVDHPEVAAELRSDVRSSWVFDVNEVELIACQLLVPYRRRTFLQRLADLFSP